MRKPNLAQTALCQICGSQFFWEKIPSSKFPIFAIIDNQCCCCGRCRSTSLPWKNKISGVSLAFFHHIFVLERVYNVGHQGTYIFSIFLAVSLLARTAFSWRQQPSCSSHHENKTGPTLSFPKVSFTVTRTWRWKIFSSRATFPAKTKPLVYPWRMVGHLGIHS